MLGCGRVGTYQVWVWVGSFIAHDLPVPGLRVLDVYPLVFEGPVLGLQKDQGPDQTGLI